MEFDYNESIRKAIENGAPEVEHEQKIESVPLPELPVRHKQFEAIQSTSKEWKAMYDGLNKKIFKGVTFALVGPRGCGKTQMAVCLIKFCCSAGKTADYRKSFEVFLRVRSSMRTEGDSESKAIEEFLKPFLLVIDAFEVRGETAFENRILDHIIDKRYDAMKTTIIISNDTQDSLEKILGESISDRMNESGGIFKMDWSSFRCKK